MTREQAEQIARKYFYSCGIPGCECALRAVIKSIMEAVAIEREAMCAAIKAEDDFTVELVEIDGNTYGLRPGAARIVKEAMADARRYRRLFDCPEPFCYRGEVFETKVVADNAIDTDMRKTP